MEDTRRLQVTEYFRARLAEEARRSERYGRRFSVIFVSCAHADPRDIFNNLRPFLRCTDIVEIIRPRPPTARGDRLTPPYAGESQSQAVAHSDEGSQDPVAMILPETDRAGAEVVLSRLRAKCHRLGDLSLGLAVYPEDATNPGDLLAKAAAAAGQTFRP